MLTKQEYAELLFNRDCSLIVIEHLDVYHKLHWTPDQFFARKSGNIIQRVCVDDPEPTTFIVLLERGLSLKTLTEIYIESGEMIVVSFRKAIEDRIGYAFVSIKKAKVVS